MASRKRPAAGAVVSNKRKASLGRPNTKLQVASMVEVCRSDPQQLSMGDACDLLEIHRLLSSVVPDRDKTLLEIAQQRASQPLPELPDVVWWRILKLMTPAARRALAQCAQYYCMMHRRRMRVAAITPLLRTTDSLVLPGRDPSWLRYDSLQALAVEHCSTEHRMGLLTNTLLKAMCRRTENPLMLIYKHQAAYLVLGDHALTLMMQPNTVFCGDLLHVARMITSGSHLYGVQTAKTRPKGRYPLFVLLNHQHWRARDPIWADACAAYRHTHMRFAVPCASTKYPELASEICVGLSYVLRGRTFVVSAADGSTVDRALVYTKYVERAYTEVDPALEPYHFDLCLEVQPDSFFKPIARYERYQAPLPVAKRD